MSDLEWGLQMTLLGMGLVFGLLALLWGLLTLVQRFDRPPVQAAAVAASAAEVESAQAAAMAPETHPGLDLELAAAIAVATLRHRAVLRREAAPAMRSYWPGSMLYASRWVGAGRARQNRSWQRRGR